MTLIDRERLGEIARRFLRLFRRVRIDHHDQQTLELREGTIQRHGTLSTGKRCRKHLIGVSVYAEVTARIQAGTRSEYDPGEHHRPGVSAAGVDETNEGALEERGAGARGTHPDAPTERLATLC